MSKPGTEVLARDQSDEEPRGSPVDLHLGDPGARIVTFSGSWWVRIGELSLLTAGLVCAALEAWRPGFLGLGRVWLWLIATASVAGAASSGRKSARRVCMATYTSIALLLVSSALRSGAIPAGDLGGLRVVILGVDGATWDVLRPMMAAGEAPNFQRLVREGATGVLQSEEPSLSPRVWTTIAAGVGPETHGAQDFFSSQASIQVKRMWEVVADRGGKVGLWGWLLTWPPVELKGFVLPSWMAGGPETWPPELGFYQRLREGGGESSVADLAGTVRESVRNGVRLPTLVRAGAVTARMRLEGWSDERSTPVTAVLQGQMGSDIFLHHYRRLGPDFAAFVFYGTDTLAHRYWKDFQPAAFEGARAEPGPYRDAIPAAYREVDGILGRFFETVDERTVLVVVSDHGTGPEPDLVSKHSIRPGALVRVLELGDEVRAFSVGIHVHLREAGREPGTEVSRFVARLTDLTVSGRPLFEVRSVTAGEYAIALRFQPQPGAVAQWPGGDAPVSDFLAASPFSGGHNLRGIIGLWGPSVRAGAELTGADLRDVAPTVLTLLGCPLSEQMDGDVLWEAFQEGARKVLIVERVDDYGPPGHQSMTRTDEETEKLQKKLRALGYLD